MNEKQRALRVWLMQYMMEFGAEPVRMPQFHASKWYQQEATKNRQHSAYIQSQGVAPLFAGSALEGYVLTQKALDLIAGDEP